MKNSEIIEMTTAELIERHKRPSPITLDEYLAEREK